MAQPSFIAIPTLVRLLNKEAARGQEYARLTGDGQLGLGPDLARITTFVDFCSEDICDVAEESTHTETASLLAYSPARKLSRQSGNYYLDVKGSTTECQSLKELLAEGLRAAEKHRPGALDKLSTIKPRTKRIVARNPHELFEQQNLVEEYAEQLMAGWWFGTNNSAEETNSWLKRACEIAGLQWGKDFSTSL